MQLRNSTLAAAAALGLALTGTALADPVDDTLTVTTEDAEITLTTVARHPTT